MKRPRPILSALFALVLSALVLTLTPLNARAAGVIYSGTWGTCPWEITADGTLTVHPGVGASQEDIYVSPWNDYSSSITSVVLAKEGGRKVVLPEDSAFLFYRLRRVTSMDLSAADASVVRTMYWMFGGCSSLVSLDLSGWDTSSAEDIR